MLLGLGGYPGAMRKPGRQFVPVCLWNGSLYIVCGQEMPHRCVRIHLKALESLPGGSPRSRPFWLSSTLES